MTEPFLMEPYKIKSTEPLHFTTREYRKKVLEKAHLNLFLIPARDVMIDLLTDSGTGAMSQAQWSALLRGDESYAGAESFFRFENTIQKITGMPYVIPTHQGRSAERILLGALKTGGEYLISNTLFDTTRANAGLLGFKVLDFPSEEMKDTESEHPFKGNIHLEKLDQALQTHSVAGVIMTITNNSGGGHPADFENIKSASRLCKKYKTPFILDACRFAENAWFIKTRNKSFQNHSPKDIARKTFDLADMCYVSAKKDGLSHIGGFISLRDNQLFTDCQNRLIPLLGFSTYGGLAGRDLEAIATGLEEALEEDYLHYRISSTAWFHGELKAASIPVVLPAGGHAVYIDVKKLTPHLSSSDHPAQAFAAGFYEFSGVRTCEIGSVMFGKSHSQELVRLAIPRRVYTQSHFNYVIQSLIRFWKEAQHLKGIEITWQPEVLRHFTARFKWKD